MADHVLETKILLRYGTYGQWLNSNIILKVGEPAIAVFPSDRSLMQRYSNITPENTPPAVGMKIGNGVDRFVDLPWVQAVAADVYNWAKEANPPAANLIPNLDDYIANYLDEHGGSGSGSGTTVAARRYQIYKGTGNNANKYFLRYRDNDEGSWTVDYNNPIDLTKLNQIVEWIGGDIDYFLSMNSYIDQFISFRLAPLDYPTQDDPITIDTPTDHYVITDITQTDGLIHAKKSRLSFEDISGTLDVEHGGTGTDYFEPGEVLVGDGDSPILTMEISTTVENTRTLVYNAAVKAYVDAAVAGLSGAMHYRGEASVLPEGGINPQVADYDFRYALAGDVVTYETKEYVWTGSGWRLLGDEGSYAVKGSIQDSDIDDEANIQMSKIADLIETFATKVDKVEGKGLSTNDFTNELLAKLSGIDDGAQANVIEHIFYNDNEVYPTIINGTSKSIDLHVKEFDDESRTKLSRIDSMEDGAQANRIERITIDGVEMGIGANKTVAITTDPHTEHENIIEEIYINEQQYYPDQHKAVHITLDESALNLHILEGANIPPITNEQPREEVDIVDKKLQLERVAKSGNIDDLLQDIGTYIIFYGGTSTEVI